MVKPCNFNILIARSMQLINWAKKHEAQLEAARNTEQPATEDGNSNPGGQTKLYTSISDKNFKERLDYIISQHIGDSDFNIDTLAGMMQLGHTKFYGKMKEITGASPNKYLMNERMRIAAQYLLEGQMTISEISYKVGFQDQSYFNRCFKQKYGTVPSKYGK
jgi:AraC-like DNA-binding protein